MRLELAPDAEGETFIVVFGAFRRVRVVDLVHRHAPVKIVEEFAAQARVDELNNQVERLTAAGSPTGRAANLQAQIAALLGEDVGWQHAIRDIGAALPAGVWLTSFQGQHTIAPPQAVNPQPTAAPAAGEDGEGSTDSESSDTTATAADASARDARQSIAPAARR